MAYKIEYSPETSKRYPQHKKRSPVKAGKYWIALFLLTAALWLRLNGIPDFLIPGDPEVTRSAVSAFMDNVELGMQIGEAVTVFCEQIIDGAGV